MVKLLEKHTLLVMPLFADRNKIGYKNFLVIKIRYIDLRNEYICI